MVVIHAVSETDAAPEFPAEAAVIETPDKVACVLAEIEAGRLRATVSDVRKYVGCSQTRAAAVRKLIAQARPIYSQEQ